MLKILRGLLVFVVIKWNGKLIPCWGDDMNRLCVLMAGVIVFTATAGAEVEVRVRPGPAGAPEQIVS